MPNLISEVKTWNILEILIKIYRNFQERNKVKLTYNVKIFLRVKVKANLLGFDKSKKSFLILMKIYMQRDCRV